MRRTKGAEKCFFSGTVRRGAANESANTFVKVIENCRIPLWCNKVTIKTQVDERWGEWCWLPEELGREGGKEGEINWMCILIQLSLPFHSGYYYNRHHPGVAEKRTDRSRLVRGLVIIAQWKITFHSQQWLDWRGGKRKFRNVTFHWLQFFSTISSPFALRRCIEMHCEAGWSGGRAKNSSRCARRWDKSEKHSVNKTIKSSFLRLN